MSSSSRPSLRHPLLAPNTNDRSPPPQSPRSKRGRKTPSFFLNSASASPNPPPNTSIPQDGDEKGFSWSQPRSNSNGSVQAMTANNGDQYSASVVRPMYRSRSRLSFNEPPLAPPMYDAPSTDPTHTIPLIDTNIKPSISMTAQTSPIRSRRPSSTFDMPFGGGSLSTSRRGSRASLAALKTALSNYTVEDPKTPPRKPIYDPSAEDLMGQDAMQTLDSYVSEVDGGLAKRSVSTLDLKSNISGGLGKEKMDALFEIHRVLYRGREVKGKEDLSWSEQSVEVKRVLNRWFETDCTYDHPLVRILGRRSFMTHFLLLHLLARGSIPSLGPTSLIHLARDFSTGLRSTLIGDNTISHSSDIEALDLEVGNGKLPTVMPLDKDQWFGLQGKKDGKSSLSLDDAPAALQNGWWRLWDIRADCTEIGGMECYDGYHMAIIDHTVTLTLLPALSSRRHTDLLLASTPSSPSLDMSTITTASHPPPSFSRRLAEALAREFDYLLHWDLPISTVVEFNEVGKATMVKDIIDIRDAVETFLPFVKRINWLTRRLSGIVTSTLGSVALAILTPPSTLSQKAKKTASLGEKKLAPPIGLGIGVKEALSDPATSMGFDKSPNIIQRPKFTIRKATNESTNSLGLEGVPSSSDEGAVRGGVSGCAPDCIPSGFGSE